MDADVLIVGGGPVGLAVAINAAARGASCVLIERHRVWPVDKACGEGLMPPAVRWLTKMDVYLSESFRFAGIRYHDGSTIAEAEFPDGPGLGVRRTVLSAGLAARARSLGAVLMSGVDLLRIETIRGGVRARTTDGTLSARWLVGADGLNSRVRSLASIACERGPTRFGMRRHHRMEQPPDKVEVHWHESGEAYVTPVGRDTVGVALLRAAERTDFDAQLDRFPALRARLGAPTDAVRGSGPFARHVPVPWKDRVVLVGDSAGYLDAITGEGLTMGWRGAEALVPLLLDGSPHRWPATAQAISRRHRLFTSLLLALARQPRLRHRVIRALAASSPAFRTLLGFNSGHYGAFRALPALLTVAGRLPLADARSAE